MLLLCNPYRFTSHILVFFKNMTLGTVVVCDYDIHRLRKGVLLYGRNMVLQREIIRFPRLGHGIAEVNLFYRIAAQLLYNTVNNQIRHNTGIQTSDTVYDDIRFMNCLQGFSGRFHALLIKHLFYPVVEVWNIAFPTYNRSILHHGIQGDDLQRAWNDLSLYVEKL